MDNFTVSQPTGSVRSVTFHPVVQHDKRLLLLISKMFVGDVSNLIVSKAQLSSKRHPITTQLSSNVRQAEIRLRNGIIDCAHQRSDNVYNINNTNKVFELHISSNAHVNVGYVVM